METRGRTSTQDQEPTSVMGPVSGEHEIIIKAVVTRANGQVEDLGVISRSKQVIPPTLLARLRATAKKVIGTD